MILLVTGCTGQMPSPSAPTSAFTPEVSATENVAATPTTAPATEAAQTDEITHEGPQLPVQLTLWTVEAVSPQAEGEAGQVFGKGLKAFEESHPDIRVSVALKNETGKGSILDYLRTASQAAPSVLPDLVVMNTVDLAQAARSGLVVPMEGLISRSTLENLLPVARNAGTVDGELVGAPFEMDVEHLVYNINKVPSIPMVWTDVLSANTTYVFPAKGRNGLVNDAFLIQYMALGGRLQDDEGRPFLDEQVLQTVLNYYRQGLEQGVIPPEVLTVGSTDEVWPEYVSAQVGITHVKSHRFLSDRSVLRSTQFGTIPTKEGTFLTIGRGRVLSIVSRDPDRQAMASRLIEWMLAPDNNIAWSRATAYLPTGYAAFDLINEDDPYWSFLEHQLEIAVPPPAFPEFDQIGRVLQQAIVEVLSQEATPEEAAAAAVDAITS